MEVAYKTRNVTLYVGDCLDIIPKIRRPIDTVVTSPPYNTLGNRAVSPSGMHKDCAWISKVNRIGYRDDMPELVYQAWLQYVVALLMHKCRGLVWINHKVRYRDGSAVHPVRFLPYPIHSEVIWRRAGSMAFNNRRFAGNHEQFWAFGRAKYWNNTVNKLLTVWSINQVRNRSDHPCPFPIELASRPIVASCPPKGTVLDPFAGSCTVGVAALAAGCNFVGIEKNPDYVPQSIERLKNWRSEVRRLVPVPLRGTPANSPRVVGLRRAHESPRRSSA